MAVLPSRPSGHLLCVYKDDNIVVLKRANGDYLGVAWNIARKSTEQGKEKMLLEFTFPAEQE